MALGDKRTITFTTIEEKTITSAKLDCIRSLLLITWLDCRVSWIVPDFRDYWLLIVESSAAPIKCHSNTTVRTDAHLHTRGELDGIHCRLCHVTLMKYRAKFSSLCENRRKSCSSRFLFCSCRSVAIFWRFAPVYLNFCNPLSSSYRFLALFFVFIVSLHSSQRTTCVLWRHLALQTGNAFVP